jgi:hypothetical protein
MKTAHPNAEMCAMELRVAKMPNVEPKITLDHAIVAMATKAIQKIDQTAVHPFQRHAAKMQIVLRRRIAVAHQFAKIPAHQITIAKAPRVASMANASIYATVCN